MKLIVQSTAFSWC